MNLLYEENRQYALDGTLASWAFAGLHEAYQTVGNFLNDVDFVLEDEKYIYMVEYKNANIPGASAPEVFRPGEEKKIRNVARKFYDSLHYLNLMKKDKPKKYIYILEYPLGDRVARGFVRNKLRKHLPFGLRNGKIGLIESVEVLSIAEWNEHEVYQRYPLKYVGSREERI